MRATRDYRSQLEQVVLLSHYCTLSADELRLSGTKTENYQPNYQAIHSAGGTRFLRAGRDDRSSWSILEGISVVWCFGGEGCYRGWLETYASNCVKLIFVRG